MGWFILVQIFSALIAIVSLGRLSEREKDLEILVLRQQLAIMKRKQSQPIRANRVEKMTLALLTAKLKEATQRPTSRLRDIIRIFQPETVLGWHRELVRRKWSYGRVQKQVRTLEPRLRCFCDQRCQMVFERFLCSEEQGWETTHRSGVGGSDILYPHSCPRLMGCAAILARWSFCTIRVHL